MFACRPNKCHGTIDLSILTDNNQYVEYTLDFKHPHLTKWVAKRIRSLFEPYLIDSKTDIMVSPSMNDTHPLYLYFMILRQHIGFRLSAVDIDKMVGRIHYFYTRKSADKSKFNAVWKRVIESKQCPWITQSVDYQLQNKGRNIAKRIMVSRLTMFYIVVKNHMYRIVKKSQKKVRT